MCFWHFSLSMHTCGDVWFSILRRKTYHPSSKALGWYFVTCLSPPQRLTPWHLWSTLKRKLHEWFECYIRAGGRGGLKSFLPSKNSDPSICSGDLKECHLTELEKTAELTAQKARWWNQSPWVSATDNLCELDWVIKLPNACFINYTIYPSLERVIRK